jgi:cell division protein FtsI (penicillin-binding protein 3)
LPRRLENGHSFAWVARRVTPDIATRVRDLIAAQGLKGIYFQKEFQRFYPGQRNSRAGAGLCGRRRQRPGRPGAEVRTATARCSGPDVHSRGCARALGFDEHEPEPGQNLVLTIDENIQFLAERLWTMRWSGPMRQRHHGGAGRAYWADSRARHSPTFNPNQFRRTTPALLKNHAVSDVYEPGSVFKLVTYSAALDQHVTTPDDMIDCQGGQITLAGRVIHDDQGEHYRSGSSA